MSGGRARRRLCGAREHGEDHTVARELLQLWLQSSFCHHCYLPWATAEARATELGKQVGRERKWQGGRHQEGVSGHGKAGTRRGKLAAETGGREVGASTRGNRWQGARGSWGKGSGCLPRFLLQCWGCDVMKILQ